MRTAPNARERSALNASLGGNERIACSIVDLIRRRIMSADDA
jgi:hypothetical protein